MNIDLLIVGSDGNGQTYFMEFCKNNNLNINDVYDRDTLKHLPSPNSLNSNIQINKCIFLYNEPYKSILSHYKRNCQYDQLLKLGNPFKLSKKDMHNLDDYENLVIKNKKDMFGIEYQFDNWFNQKTKFPILFLDFNKVLENSNIIDDFLNTKLNYNLFKVKERVSDIKKNNNLDKNKMIILKIYNSLYEKIKIKTNTNIDLLIVGPGGYGQTYFMEFCKNNNLNTNNIHDKDRLKHLSNPTNLNNKIKVKRCIFLYDNLYNLILSHYEEKWQYNVLLKLENPYKLSKQDMYNFNDYKKLVLKNKKDMLGIENQFNNWFNKKTNFPILFLDFNTILDNSNMIDNFLNTKLNYELFKNNKILNKDINKHPDFSQIYNKLYEKMKNKSIEKNSQFI